MKRSIFTLVVFAIFAVSRAASAAVILSEGFNQATIPSGWTLSNATPVTFVTTSANPTAAPYEGTHFVKFASFDLSGVRSQLVSPSMSTMGKANITVSFAWHRDTGYATYWDRVYVQYSTNGTTWTDVAVYPRTNTVTGWQLTTCALPGITSNLPSLYIAFLFVSAYGNNCYLDAVTVYDAVPEVALTPATQSGSAFPGDAVAFNVTLANKTGLNDSFALSYINSAWPAVGPAATGIVGNNASTAFVCSITVPTNAMVGQVSTTTVMAVNTSDNSFTGTAQVVAQTTWRKTLSCQTFTGAFPPAGWQNVSLNDPIGWTNAVPGADGTGACAFHNDDNADCNDWLISPQYVLTQDFGQLSLTFQNKIGFPTYYDASRVYLSTGSANPTSGDYQLLLDVGDTDTTWTERELDLTPFKGKSVYIAFQYVGVYAHEWSVDNVCINGVKTGIDNAQLFGPPTLPTITSYGSTLAVTGGMSSAGQTGPSGPAPFTTAELGFGPTGTVPNSATWTWFPATYRGAGGNYDLYTAAPQLTIAGPLNYCYRFRRGLATWVYGDLDGSTNGFNLGKAGVITVNMLPPQGALLRNQTIGLDWAVGPSSFVDPSNTPAIYQETGDDISLPYDAHLKSVRMGGIYWNAGRQGLEAGFWLRIYNNAVTNPGTMLYQQYVPGYACEQLIGVDAAGYDDYKYQVNLTVPFLATAGSTYWISLQQETRNGTYWSLLDSPDAVRGLSACQRSAAAGVWSSLGVDLGLEVYGVVTNAGFVAGTVRDADTLLPIEAAQLMITNASYINSMLTIANGTYVTPAPAGTYNITVTKANYLPATAAGVTVVVGQTNTQDFLLEGSQLYVSPTNITRSMVVGQILTNQLVLTNSGPLAVNYTLSIGNFATSALTRLRTISLPPCDGNFPRGTAPLSLCRAPQAPGSAAATATMAPLAAVIKGYAFNIYPASPNALISFMTDAPSAYTTIGTANTGASGFVCGAAFLGGDFSQILCLVYADNKLVKVNTATAAVTVIATCTPPGTEGWTGMAVDPTTGILYASAYGTVSKLYTLNPITGVPTLVGEITNGGLTIGIAINAAGQMYGLDLSDYLISINKATGAGTVIGSIGYDANYAQDLAFDLANNVLYVAAYNNVTSLGELRVADTTSGNTILIGAFSATGIEVDGFATMTSSAKQWARVATNAGALAAGGVGTVEVIFDATVVSNAGIYTAGLTINGTHVNPLAPVPLMMIIPEPACALGLLGLALLTRRRS